MGGWGMDRLGRVVFDCLRSLFVWVLLRFQYSTLVPQHSVA